VHDPNARHAIVNPATLRCRRGGEHSADEGIGRKWRRSSISVRGSMPAGARWIFPPDATSKAFRIF
jgi:hypothetical protein